MTLTKMMNSRKKGEKLFKRQQMGIKITKSNYNGIESCKLNELLILYNWKRKLIEERCK